MTTADGSQTGWGAMLWQRFSEHPRWRLLLELFVVLAALRCIGEAHDQTGPDGALLVSVAQGMLAVMGMLLLARMIRGWDLAICGGGIVLILCTSLIVLRLDQSGLSGFAVLLTEHVGIYVLMFVFVGFWLQLLPLLFRRGAPGAPPLLTTFPVLVATFLPAIALSDAIQFNAMRLAVQQAKPLVAAVYQYQQVHDAWPDRLKDLVPAFLSSVPTPTLGWDDSFLYQRLEGDWQLSIFGIDRMEMRMVYTGVTNGPPPPFSAQLWAVHR